MFAVRKVLQETTLINVSRRFSSTSIYDIQERTAQELSPYTKKPSNTFSIFDNTDRKQLGELAKFNRIQKNGRSNNTLLEPHDSRINGLNSLH